MSCGFWLPTAGTSRRRPEPSASCILISRDIAHPAPGYVFRQPCFCRAPARRWMGGASKSDQTGTTSQRRLQRQSGQLRCQEHLDVDGKSYEIFRLDARCRARALTSRRCRSASRCCWRTCSAPRTAPTSPPTTSRRWPAGTNADAEPDSEIQFTPARVIMQDFTGVPCVVDLATMREAMADLGGDPSKINPLAPPRWSSTTR